jgi:ATP-dependent protease ClpP protease subunit
MDNHKAKPWRFENSAKQLDVFIYGEIGGDELDGGVTAASFVNDLRKAGPVSLIHLHINSPGGSVFAAVAIHNSLLNSGARVICSIDGVAASAATLVCMAAQTIDMPRNGMFMIHLPNASLFSAESSELRKMADVMDRMTETMISMYRRHSHLSAAEIRQLLVAESWLDAPTALAKGFITEISDESGDLSIAACADMSRYKHVPAAIAARLQTAPLTYDRMSLSELETAHEQLLLQRRLLDLKYGRMENV